MTGGPLLELVDLQAGYGAATVLHGVSLSVRVGSVTALLGGNGAGKSTLMRAVAGILKARGGRVLFKGRDIGAEPAHWRVSAGIALVPEGRLVFPTMTVEENLRLGAISPRARDGRGIRLAEIFRQFPRLHERSRQLASTLSGGEQQMLALGRGLMAKPELVLLDEPTLGLAPIMVKQFFAVVEQLRSENYTILIAEQDVRRTLEAADQAFVIESGRVVLSGTGAELANDPAVQRAYMGL
jgi:branched-chain amino acid transport system ATP-binding protein